MQEKSLIVEKTARYHTLGQLTSSIDEVWYVFHGYGQLSSEILEQFTYIDEGKRYFIAPEGLSRFYTSGNSGKTGASWMTSEQRESEIRDYIKYLNQLHQHIREQSEHQLYKTVLFGFSQGVATACRWLAQVNIPADSLVLWAGTIPKEIDMWRIKAHYPSLIVYMIYGTQDRFAQPDVIKEQEERLQKAEMNYRKIRFDGKHELHPPTMVKLFG